MLNSQLNTNQFNNANLSPGTTIDTAIIVADLGPDINVSKYVFIQKNGEEIVKQINLADFFDNENDLGLHFLDDNIRNLPNKDIGTYENPFGDGGKIISEKFPDKEISIRLKVVADSFYNLEATLIDLKTRFNKGGQLQINENGYLKYLDVVLENFEVDANEGIGRECEIEVSFKSVTPIKKSKTKTISSLGNTGDIQLSASILDSNENIVPEFKVLVKSISGDVDSVTISYDGFDIKYTGTIIAGDIIEFSGNKGTCLVNDIESDFDGVIRTIESGKQTIIDITFEGAGEPDYSLYILYNNLSL